MAEKEVDIQIFMMRESRGFEDIETKYQFLQIAEQADGFIQKWYYEKGSSNKLQNTLESFIIKLKSFICSKRIEDINKYNDEYWYEFLNRMRIYCDSMNI
ncbi:hypothetical protein DMUE_0144 [Dictyocoela muelleri]|nr:hypothetical protein DMUE_0144 [Dictyocoela muelleri]